MNVFYLKKGDRNPLLRVQVIHRLSKLPVDITGATITFSMIDSAGAAIIEDAAGTVDDGDEGILKYSWVDGDTDVIGIFRGEFKIILPDTSVFRVPSNGYIPIIIGEAITT